MGSLAGMHAYIGVRGGRGRRSIGKVTTVLVSSALDMLQGLFARWTTMCMVLGGRCRVTEWCRDRWGVTRRQSSSSVASVLPITSIHAVRRANAIRRSSTRSSSSSLFPAIPPPPPHLHLVQYILSVFTTRRSLIDRRLLLVSTDTQPEEQHEGEEAENPPQEARGSDVFGSDASGNDAIGSRRAIDCLLW